jgi:hypothetical protein
MASWREIDRIRKNLKEVRAIALRLLKLYGAELTDWETSFLESIVRDDPDVEELTTRQAEKLVEIRDGVELISEYRGFSVRILLEKILLARLDLSENDEDWIVARCARSTSFIARKHASKMLHLAYQLDLVDADDEAA